MDAANILRIYTGLTVRGPTVRFLRAESWAPEVGPSGRNPPTGIYPSIVGRIYPITVYKFNGHVFPKCWQLLSNMNIYYIHIKNVCYGTLRPKGAHSPFDV